GRDGSPVLRHDRRGQGEAAGATGEQQGFEDPLIVQASHVSLPIEMSRPAETPAREQGSEPQSAHASSAPANAGALENCAGGACSNPTQDGPVSMRGFVSAGPMRRD